jgi:DNA modification methylase
VSIIHTSPPYNRKRNDKYQDFIDINKDWLQLNIDVITQLLRVTKSTYFITFRLIIIIDVYKLIGF